MARARRTKKRYQDLYDDPSGLLPGAKVILFPNGAPEIWIQSLDGRYSLKLTGGMGPAGFGLTISKSVGSTPITVYGIEQSFDGEPFPQQLPEVTEVSLVQYHQDAWSQAFKAWCQKRGGYPGDPGPPHQTP